MRPFTYTPEEYRLYKLKVATRRAVTDQEMANLRIDVDRFYDDMLSGMVYELRGEILAEKLVEDEYDVTFRWKVPATWWQHVKLWLNSLGADLNVTYEHHTETKTVEFTRYAKYPKAQYRTDTLGDPVTLEQVRLRDG